MKNYQQQGHVAPYTNTTGSAIAAGAVVVLDDRVGIATVDIPDTKSGPVHVGEAVFGPFDAVVAEYAGMALGTTVYWDPVAGKVTTTAGMLTKMGFVFEKLGGNTVNVKINAN